MRATYRYCASCKELHDIELWPALCMSAPPKRSDLKAPMLIRDSCDPVQSMLDGKYYDSKSTLRRTYKQAGVTEVGNDKPPPFKKPRPDRKAMKAAVRKAASRVGLGAV